MRARNELIYQLWIRKVPLQDLIKIHSFFPTQTARRKSKKNYAFITVTSIDAFSFRLLNQKSCGTLVLISPIYFFSEPLMK